jgi:hypothetical protein
MLNFFSGKGIPSSLKAGMPLLFLAFDGDCGTIKYGICYLNALMIPFVLHIPEKIFIFQ